MTGSNNPPQRSNWGKTLNFIGDHPILSVIMGMVVLGGAADIAGSIRGNNPEVVHGQRTGSNIEETYIHHDGADFYRSIDGVSLEGASIGEYEVNIGGVTYVRADTEATR